MPPTDAGQRAGSTRAVPRALLIAAALLMAARIVGIVLEKPPASSPGRMTRSGPANRAGLADRVTWVPAEHADAVARAEGKPLLYDFSAEWCGPCRVMERELYADSVAASFISNQFVPVHVVDRQREEGRNAPIVDSLQSAYRVQAFPTLVVAWPGGGASRLARGYRGMDATLAWLTSSAAEVRMRSTGVVPGLPGR